MVSKFLFEAWKFRKKWHRDINDKLDALMSMICKPEDELSVLCDKYGSDKGSVYKEVHTYTSEYFKLFSENRDNIKSVFECGIGTNNPKLPSSMGLFGSPGASLRVWRDYFKNAVVIGADIDKNILFEETRIHTAFIDQTNPEKIENLFHSLAPEYPNSFDIMIDDGLHTFEAGVCLFENSFQYLNKNGYYVIEDIHHTKIPQFEQYFASCKYKDDINVEYKTMYTKWKPDNNLVVIQKKQTH
jgi:hypothetical protein